MLDGQCKAHRCAQGQGNSVRSHHDSRSAPVPRGVGGSMPMMPTHDGAQGDLALALVQEQITLRQGPE